MIFHQFFPEDRFLLVLFSGEVANGELHELTTSVIQQLSEVRPTEGLRHLSVACERFTIANLPLRDVILSAGMIRKDVFRECGKAAFVANSAVTFGFFRVFQQLIDVDDTRVVGRDGLTDAIRWLGIEHMENDILNTIGKLEQES